MRVLQAIGRQVHGDGEVEPGPRPFGAPGQGRAEDPDSERPDQPGLLGQGNKQVG